MMKKKFKLHEKDIRELLPYTPISRALGYKPQEYAYMTGDMQVESSQMEYVNKIIKLNQDSMQLYQRVQLQSLVYKDVEACSLCGTINKAEIEDVYSYIPPLLFALFIPKFDDLEKRMLLTSMSKLIVLRKEGQSLKTLSEVELFEDLCRDPIETQCTVEVEPFKDIYKRCTLQVSLWMCVLHLRQGRYYCNEGNNFLNNLENCKNIVFDSPDFAFVKDVGHLYRKLLNCFSYRPIHVFTTPPQHALSSIQSHPIVSMNIGVETTIPMQVCRLPITSNNMFANIPQEEPKTLQEYVRSNQIFIKGKSLVAKEQQIICCNGVLVFYVPRRLQSLDENSYTSASHYNIKKLPVTTTTLERINTSVIKYCDSVVLGQTQVFMLKSLVVVETIKSDLFGENQEEREIIIGTSAIVIPESDKEGPCGYYYCPVEGRCNENHYSEIKPIKAINHDDIISNYQNYGTLYVYKTQEKTALCDFYN